MLLQLERMDEAEPALREAVRLGGTYRHKALIDLGIVQARQGQLEKAVASFQQAVAVRPDVVECHENLGLAYMDTRRYAKAVESLQQAQALALEQGREQYAASLAPLIARARAAMRLRP